MKKVDITNMYIDSLQEFTDTVCLERNLYTVYSQSGRKYDKVIEKTKSGHEKILFFIERATGTIYGRKNDISPNLFWWFNTIYTSYKWDWTGWPKPMSDDSVEVVYIYGDEIRHYAPINEVKSPVKKHKALDISTV